MLSPEIFRSKYDESTKTWYNYRIPRLYHDTVSIGHVAIIELGKHPNRVVQINDNNGYTMTAREMRSKIIRSAVNLERLKLEQADVVGVVAGNHHFLAPIVFGSLLNGYTINGVDITFSEDDIAHMFNITRPKIILLDFDQYEKTRRATDSIDLHPVFITFDQRLEGCEYIEDFFKETPREFLYMPVNLKFGAKQASFIVCSSGTTGYHKGICISHGQFIKKIMVRDGFSDSVLFCTSSLYWLTGIDFMITSAILVWKRIITTNPFVPERFFKMLVEYKISNTLLPASNMALIIQSPEFETSDFSTVHYFAVTGSAAPEAYFQAIQDKLTNGLATPAYAMTELCGICTLNVTRKFDSVGGLFLDIEARIINENGDALGINETGEILLRDPNYPFLGYKNNEEATKETLDNDGWVHTGDIGHFDEKGILRITDRKKDILKYRNFHVSPTELEEILLSYGNGIKLACVFGVPDPNSTDLPAALIVKDGTVNEDDFSKYIDEKLPDYKKLRGGIYYVDSIPQTVNGKFKRNDVKQIGIKLFKAQSQKK